jgi:hypothetical protein
MNALAAVEALVDPGEPYLLLYGIHTTQLRSEFSPSPCGYGSHTSAERFAKPANL